MGASTTQNTQTTTIVITRFTTYVLQIYNDKILFA